MGFEFGVITDLNFDITLYCFIAVVSFVIVFEYLIGIMEYFLEGSHLYSHMIQMIYKELMLMGLVTFCVIMYEAAPDGGVSETEEDWITAIDFSHVYLFFVTFFFVMHAFYLMLMSVWSASTYRSMFTEKTLDLTGALEKVKASTYDAFLFSVKELPLCSVRNRVEFSMIHSLFTKTYLLPEDFDFPYYLSGCFDRFALRTINRSMFTWVVLLVIVACNFIRILVGLSCQVPSEEEPAERRFLQEAGTDETAEPGAGHDGCKEETIYIFLFCGLALIAYTLILTMVSRLYKLRLVDKVYPNHNTIDDYLGLLRTKHANRHANDPLASLRMSSSVLKKEIEIEFDEEEEGEVEDEEGIKFLAELLLSGYRWAKETYSDANVHLRVWLAECYGNRAERRKNRLGIFSSSMNMKASADAEGAAAAAAAGAAPGARERTASMGGHHGRVTEEKKVYVPLKHRLTVSKVVPGAGSSSRHGSPRAGAAGGSEIDGAASVASAGAASGASGVSGHNHNSPGLFDCCHSKELEEDEEAEFKSIFVGGHPLWYFRAVELQIMFTCMYMALWATNFITIVKDTDDISASHQGLYQFLMLIPILVAFHRIAYIAETYSLILAISELNIEVIYEVLVNTEDMHRLAEELRSKIMSKIRSWSGVNEPSEEQEKEFVHQLFMEIDQDGSGTIDKGEFRMMLRKLNLTYSDHRFNLLFRAVDSIGGDGSLEEEELVSFMFPGNGSQYGDDVIDGDMDSILGGSTTLSAVPAGNRPASNSDLGLALPGGKMNPML